MSPCWCRYTYHMYFLSLKPSTLDFHDNAHACAFWWLLDPNMSAASLARLLSFSVTDLQPYSFSSSSHADSSSLHSSGWEQLGGSHVANTLLMCMCRARLTLPMEISVTTMSIPLMCQLDLFIVLSNEPETNGCCGSVAYPNISFQTRLAFIFHQFDVSVLVKFMWYHDLVFHFWKRNTLA